MQTRDEVESIRRDSSNIKRTADKESEKGVYHRAIHFLKEALTIRNQVVNKTWEDHQFIAYCLLNLGFNEGKNSNNTDKEIEYYQQAIAQMALIHIDESVKDYYDDMVGYFYHNLIHTCCQKKDFAAALKYGDELIDIVAPSTWVKNYDQLIHKIIRLYTDLIGNAKKESSYAVMEAALGTIDKLFLLLRETNSADLVQRASLRERLAQVYDNVDQTARKRQAYLDAQNICAKVPNKDRDVYWHITMGRIHNELGKTYGELGLTDDYVVTIGQGVQILEEIPKESRTNEAKQELAIGYLFWCHALNDTPDMVKKCKAVLAELNMADLPANDYCYEIIADFKYRLCNHPTFDTEPQQRILNWLDYLKLVGSAKDTSRETEIRACHSSLSKLYEEVGNPYMAASYHYLFGKRLKREEPVKTATEYFAAIDSLQAASVKTKEIWELKAAIEQSTIKLYEKRIKPERELIAIRKIVEQMQDEEALKPVKRKAASILEGSIFKAPREDAAASAASSPESDLDSLRIAVCPF